MIKRLGSGNFGHVDKAVATGLYGYPGQVTVAVKTLKGDCMRTSIYIENTT